VCPSAGCDSWNLFDRRAPQQPKNVWSQSFDEVESRHMHTGPRHDPGHPGTPPRGRLVGALPFTNQPRVRNVHPVLRKYRPWPVADRTSHTKYENFRRRPTRPPTAPQTCLTSAPPPQRRRPSLPTLSQTCGVPCPSLWLTQCEGGALHHTQN
jgi:hypothetical protein